MGIQSATELLVAYVKSVKIIIYSPVHDRCDCHAPEPAQGRRPQDRGRHGRCVRGGDHRRPQLGRGGREAPKGECLYMTVPCSAMQFHMTSYCTWRTPMMNVHESFWVPLMVQTTLRRTVTTMISRPMQIVMHLCLSLMLSDISVGPIPDAFHSLPYPADPWHRQGQELGDQAELGLAFW